MKAPSWSPRALRTQGRHQRKHKNYLLWFEMLEIIHRFVNLVCRCHADPLAPAAAAAELP